MCESKSIKKAQKVRLTTEEVVRLKRYVNSKLTYREAYEELNINYRTLKAMQKDKTCAPDTKEKVFRILNERITQ